MAPEIATAEILGVRIACLDQAGLLQAFAGRLDDPAGDHPYTLGYANSYVLNLAQSDSGYRARINAFDLVYADGFGAVLAGRILGTCPLVKLTGADYIHLVFKTLAARRASVFILAGKPGVAERAGAYYQRLYPGFELAGTADGYFERESSEQVVERIRIAAPDVLFVGMGTNRQEGWIGMHADRLPVKICWAVGGLFDYAAGALRRAPRWMLRLQLEWLWRLIVDPAGTWRRYLLETPVFFLRVLQARFRSKG